MWTASLYEEFNNWETLSRNFYAGGEHQASVL